MRQQHKQWVTVCATERRSSTVDGEIIDSEFRLMRPFVVRLNLPEGASFTFVELKPLGCIAVSLWYSLAMV